MNEISYPIKLLIADDHEILASGMSSILSKKEELEILGTVSNGQEVLDYLAKNEVDVVIMDLNMPVLNGIEATEIIKKNFPKTKVLILSMFDREGYIQNALDVGVDGYVLKNVSEEEIVSAVRRIMEGKTYFSQDVMAKMAMKMRVYGESEGGIKLTDTERKILQYLSEGDTSGEISEKLDLASNTISSYRKLLLQKFEAKNVSHMVKMAYEKGYLG
ncbi:response regulator transcription factor [Marivirga harenae]|uniref:response regulator transcription factor n=1 Tax=Marivirga harenae TaxID=2010992 RepID=UPI0026DF4656|nr:response regulator transcription factor [Marivirga harenae]WKV10870.1 response regulator transcription factor [Marivirga harenae]|tara:strand:+ start:152814 stop:153464 length:651 start_codon:yes stop_codon:yes gene_type:complete